MYCTYVLFEFFLSLITCLYWGKGSVLYVLYEWFQFFLPYSLVYIEEKGKGQSDEKSFEWVEDIKHEWRISIQKLFWSVLLQSFYRYVGIWPANLISKVFTENKRTDSPTHILNVLYTSHLTPTSFEEICCFYPAWIF